MANPWENYILERIYRVIANRVRTLDLQNNYLDEDDPWSGILAATSFEVCIMYHTTLQAISGQLVFGGDMILNTPFIEDWGAIRRLKQQLIDKDNKNINKDRKSHSYKVRKKLLARQKSKQIRGYV